MLESRQYNILGFENSKTAKWIPLFVWAISFAVYRLTMAPTVIWGDSAGLALRVHNLLLDPASDGHPLYILLGKCFSFLPGDLSVNLNFMSVVFASFTVLLVFLIIKQLTRHNFPAAAGAASFQFSHAFWCHAVVAEVYALNAFFMAFIIYVMFLWKDSKSKEKYLFAGAFLFGLSLSHHLVLALFGISIIYFLVVQQKEIFTFPNWKHLSKLLFSFLAGFSIFIVLFIYWSLAYSSKETISITVGRQHAQYMFRFPIKMVLTNIGFYLAYQFYQFPILGFFLGWKGIKDMFLKERDLCIFLFSIILVNSVFFIGFVNLYRTSNYTFYVTDYMIFSLFIGYGIHTLIQKWMGLERGIIKKRVVTLFLLLCFLPTAGYFLTPFVSQRMGIDLLGARQIPYRDNGWFFLFPPKNNYRGALKFGMEALKDLKEGATIVADYTPCAVLEYLQQVKKVRPDVLIVDVNDATKGTHQNNLRPFVDKNYEGGAIYLADIESKWYYNLKDFPPDFKVEKRGIVYQVVKTDKLKK